MASSRKPDTDGRLAAAVTDWLAGKGGMTEVSTRHRVGYARLRFEINRLGLSDHRPRRERGDNPPWPRLPFDSSLILGDWRRGDGIKTIAYRYALSTGMVAEILRDVSGKKDGTKLSRPGIRTVSRKSLLVVPTRDDLIYLAGWFDSTGTVDTRRKKGQTNALYSIAWNGVDGRREEWARERIKAGQGPIKFFRSSGRRSSRMVCSSQLSVLQLAVGLEPFAVKMKPRLTHVINDLVDKYGDFDPTMTRSAARRVFGIFEEDPYEVPDRGLPAGEGSSPRG